MNNFSVNFFLRGKNDKNSKQNLIWWIKRDQVENVSQLNRLTII